MKCFTKSWFVTFPPFSNIKSRIASIVNTLGTAILKTTAVRWEQLTHELRWGFDGWIGIVINFCDCSLGSQPMVHIMEQQFFYSKVVISEWEMFHKRWLLKIKYITTYSNINLLTTHKLMYEVQVKPEKSETDMAIKIHKQRP